MPINEASQYVKGGFAPFHLGDRLNNRYRLVHKVGHGDEGTVWLAMIDPPLQSVNIRYVALKILRADLSGNTVVNNELQILEHLKQQSSTDENRHEGERSIVRLLNTFHVSTPNGTHLVLVLPFRGLPLKDLNLKTGLLLTRHKRMKVGKQIAMGVAYLHQVGVAHGDLTATNVLLEIQDIQKWTVDELYLRLGSPKKVPFAAALQVEDEELFKKNDHSGSEGSSTGQTLGKDTPLATPHRPAYVVSAIAVDHRHVHLFGDIVTIIDFGRAFLCDPTTAAIQRPNLPIFYPAPEAVLNFRITEKYDIWFLGCLIYSVQTGNVLFEGPFNGGFQRNKHENEAMDCLDSVYGNAIKPNGNSCGGYDKLKKQVLDDELHATNFKLRNQVMITTGRFGEPDLADLLRDTLRLNPDFRISAEEALKYRYFLDRSNMP